MLRMVCHATFEERIQKTTAEAVKRIVRKNTQYTFASNTKQAGHYWVPCSPRGAASPRALPRPL